MPCDKIVLVYFLGGITFAEIAALKLLGKMKGIWGYEFKHVWQILPHFAGIMLQELTV